MIKNIEMTQKVFFKAYKVFFTVLVLSLIIVDKRIEYFSPLKCFYSNFTLALVGIVILLGLCMFKKKIKAFVDKFTTRECWFILVIASMILYGVQMYIIYNIYYKSGWDCGVIAEMSEKVARGELLIRDSAHYSAYLSENPHQAFMVFILTIIKKISNHFGIQDMYYFSVMVGTLCVNMTCVLTTLVVKNIKGRYYAFCTFVSAAIFLALSPQSSVPYTDVYVMVINAMVIYLYTWKGKAVRFKWLVIGIMAFIGYYVKATAIICFISIGICEFFKSLKMEVHIGAKRIAKGIFIILISYIFSSGIASFGVHYIGFEQDINKEFTPLHYAMMGLNEESTGIWNSDDVQYSASFDNLSDRQKANFKVIKERIQEKGLLGLLLFEYKKLIMNYNDGTFFFGKEGGAMLWKSDAPNHTACEILRYYYFRKGNKVMNHVLQTQWLMILMMVLAAAWSFVKKFSDIEFVLAVTVVGITLFTLMFEGRSRYLLLYAPYYLILGIIGVGIFEKKVHDLYIHSKSYFKKIGIL